MGGELEGGASGGPVDPGCDFEKKPVAARLLVVCAGVAMNALLAFVIFAALAGSVGTPELNTTQVDSVRAAKITKDRKSTRLNSSHLVISYAVFCLRQKTSITTAVVQPTV